MTALVNSPVVAPRGSGGVSVPFQQGDGHAPGTVPIRGRGAEQMGLHERFDELAYLLTMTVGVFQLIVHPRASSLDPVPGGLLRAPVAARNQRDGSRNGERVTIPDREGVLPRPGPASSSPPRHLT